MAPLMQKGLVMRWVELAVWLMIAAVGCGNSSSAPPDGASFDAHLSADAAVDAAVDATIDAGLVCPERPSYCDSVVSVPSQCPTPQQLCAPTTCAAHECCYCMAGPSGPSWGVIVTDCFEGCSIPDAGPADAGSI